MNVFLVLQCIFRAYPQVLHQGPRAEWIRSECTYLGLQKNGLQFEKEWLAKQLHREDQPSDEGGWGTLERCPWNAPQVILYSFLQPYGQGQHYHGLAMWRWFVLHLFVFQCFTFSYTFSILHQFLYSHLFAFQCSRRFVIACHTIQRHIMVLVLTMGIFATPLTMLELPSYVVKLAH